MKFVNFLGIITFLLILQSSKVFAQTNFNRQYVRVNPDLEIYYIEAGSGTPIIFIPGWIGTSSFYEKQVAYFSKRYRAISYDPRSQGRSSKTLEGNNYVQHGADLKALMDTLHLKDVVLVGHSNGCLEIYAYVRAFGIQNVKAIVFIDHPPKTVSEQKGDWVGYNSFNEMREFYNGISHDRLNFTKAFLKNIFTRQLKEEELNWFTDELMKSPTYVALLQDYDANMSDFTKEAQMLDGKIPVLNVLSDQPGYTEYAKEWLSKNAPHSKIEAFGLHFMCWEFADKFNSVVDTFLTNR
jgi:non-heme chloroperoxidase